MIPGELTLQFNFRHATVSTQDSLRERFEAMLRKHGLDFTLRWPSSGQPYLTPRGKLLADEVSAHCVVVPSGTYRDAH